MGGWRECRRYAQDFEDHSRACHLPGHRRVVDPETCTACPVPALVEAVEAAVECGNKHIGLTAEACGCYIASCEAALAALPAEGERGEET